jgi:hypothetical protein
MLFKK